MLKIIMQCFVFFAFIAYVLAAGTLLVQKLQNAWREMSGNHDSVDITLNQMFVGDVNPDVGVSGFAASQVARRDAYHFLHKP